MLTLENHITMEELTATIAHEIKNPLQLLRSNLQLMQLDDVAHKYQKNFNVMYSELERINALVIDFINITNPLKYNFGAVNLNNLINEVVEIFKGSIAKEKIVIAINDSAQNIIIKADRDKLKQVFINIIKNAIEAVCEMEEQRQIDISTSINEKHASIVIKDNGVGISETTLQSIGTPYFTTKQKGSGLGLSLSRYIIDKHDGCFNITSIEGLGTTVTIELNIEII